ncbi:MAG TPA: response regulator [Vicinamibacteria bacterium]|nr:response regulator [Vicinamibacteria bacterium]
MVVLIVLVTFVVFVLVDLFLRLTLKRLEEKKVRLAREKALEVGLRLEFADEAKSLKRVEVSNPKARILAVDDEAVILDSFRKILVVAGYSVDTVLTGPEALGLVRKNHYDFVFTDFKMPDMDGVEVTKAVKHLRPDVDVVMITGYASIESAVETMKHGAMDYVQKPFAEDELVALVDKLVIRRQARLEKETEPSIRLVTPSVGESQSRHEVNVPAGVFVSDAHAWVSVHMNGLVRLGIDDFTQKTIGQIDSVELPASGAAIKKGATLFTLRHGDHRLAVPAPVSGRVTGVNAELVERPELIKLKPYQLGWVCTMDPANLTDDLHDLRIGAAAVSWYGQEINRYGEMIRAALRAREGEGKSVRNGKDEGLDDLTWEVFEKALVRP